MISYPVVTSSITLDNRRIYMAADVTAKAIRNQDYEFLSGEIVGKTDNGNYKVRGLEELAIPAFIGRKDYGPGERVIVARLNDELNLISE